MQKLLRTTSDNKDFKILTTLFDDYLIDIDGDEKDFFAQYNHINLDNVVVCYFGNIAVGCGAFKIHEKNIVELKRMFVHPDYRGLSIAKNILNELENWLKDLNKSTIILETSIRLEAAIALYKKSGYQRIENYGQYIGIASSYCMKKTIT
ncbi:MAG: GNAT family N-acetyltransferase [Flavobacterium sp.]|nr:GNAT family N-acetyltransferase [Flavobacterium sp.]